MSDKITHESTYIITTMKDVYNPQINERYKLSWKGVRRFLTKPRDPVGKFNQISFSPGRFNGRVNNKNCIDLHLMIFDVDEKLANVHRVIDSLHRFKIKHILYTSSSHTNQKHRFRLVLPLREPIEKKYWKHVYEYALTWYESVFFHDADAKCKDPRRIFFTSYKTNKDFKTSYLDEGRTYDFLSRGKELYEKEQAEIERLRLKRKEDFEKSIRITREKHWENANISHSDKIEQAIKALKSDSKKRSALAVNLGCRVDGNKASYFRCPFCKRRDATYFWIDPGRSTGAYCHHANSCGGGIPRFIEIGDLADYYGFLLD